jgi:hypothetical protein
MYKHICIYGCTYINIPSLSEDNDTIWGQAYVRKYICEISLQHLLCPFLVIIFKQTSSSSQENDTIWS